MDFIAWHDKNSADHKTKTDTNAALGYRFLSLSIYNTTQNPLYAAVMVKRPNIVAQHEFPGQTLAQFNQTKQAQAQLGFGPTIISATGPSNAPLFASVFEPASNLPFSDPAMTAADFASRNASAAPASILTWAAVYGDPGNERFAGIWHLNPSKTIWNADGINETLAVSQQRFNAQTSSFARLRFMTSSRGQRFLSIYSDDQIGPWLAEGNLTSAGYQTAFNTQTANGFFPLVVQAAGEGAAARFSVIFTKQETILPRGPVVTSSASTSVPAIDAAMQAIMQGSNVRGASLAITKGTRLVYAAGYTNAEAGYPQTKPLTYFRLASLSKTITALAIHVLIEQGSISLGKTVQSILNLKTPSGQAPADPNFNSITVQNLLEMNSGLPTDFSGNEPKAIAAINAAHPAQLPFHLPATPDQIASYMVSLGGSVPPNTSNAYSNFGYFMLGRIISHVTGQDYFTAVSNLVLHPLHINTTNHNAAGIRLSQSLVSAQLPNEARYHSPDLVLRPSVMSDDRPLVGREYGDEGLEAGAPAGGISASTAAMARIIAYYSSQASPSAIPKLSYATTEAILKASMSSFRGHGFDGVDQPGGVYRAQKGGLLETSQSGLSFTVGGIGFVVCWNTKGVAGDWYPYFPEIVNAAKAHDWGTTDLFPQFNMPSF